MPKHFPPRRVPPRDPSTDPLTCPISHSKDTRIEIITDNNTLGLFLVGGRETHIPDGIIIVEVYDDCVADKDGRLQPGDQILEANGISLKGATSTTASLAIRQTLPKMKLTIYRPEKLEYQLIEAELVRKPGKGLGLNVVARKNGKGIYISDIISGTPADIDGKVKRGDLLLSVNGQNMENASCEEAGVILKTAMGKVAFKFNRFKAVVR